MEDYFRAFTARNSDTLVLKANNRMHAMMHFGGVTIECLIKSLIVDKYKIDGWNTNEDGKQHGIKNPGHELMEAIRLIPKLRHRVPNNMLTYIELLQNPKFSFIDMRYDSQDLDEVLLISWLNAYKRVRAWLLSQRSTKLK